LSSIRPPGNDTRCGLQLLAAGQVPLAIGQSQPLEQAAAAHQAIADRSVIGKAILTT
jgi:NADPH2:quinone reductase